MALLLAVGALLPISWLPLGTARQAPSWGYDYLIVEKVHYYGGAQAAFIFRVDDYTVDPSYSSLLPDDFARPARYFRNYQGMLVRHVTREYPWLRLTVGVITSCPSHNCSSGWDELRELVNVYGWEAASHTRDHTRPPRARSDYLGSLADIESNITGYKVLTYIEPFGRVGPGELDDLARHGVRVVMDSLPWLPEPMGFSGPLTKIHFTVKASGRLPWRKLFDASLKEALASGRIMVFYTHATSYDWPDPRGLLEAVDYAASSLSGQRFWVTTPGELYSYYRVYEESRVEYHVEGDRLVVDVSGGALGDAWRVPLTVLVYTGDARVVDVEANGARLPRLEASWLLSKPRAGYIVGDGFIAVNVFPPAHVEIQLQGGHRYVPLPGGLVGLDSGLAKARLAALALWAPAVGRAAVAYRRARARRQAAPRRGGARRVRYAAVIPARNASEYIGDVLESLMAQSLTPTVIAVVDDASGDGTAARASRAVEGMGGALVGAGSRAGYDELIYELDGVRVHVMRSRRHRGKAYNVNRAVEALASSYEFDHVLILDSDTILDRRAAERLAARLESDPATAAAMGLVLLWKPDKRGTLAMALASAFRNVGGAILSLGLRLIESLSGSLGGASGAVMMVRKDALLELGGLPEDSLADDTVFTWKLQLEGYRAVLAHDAVAYTVDPGSVSGLARKSYRISAGLVEGVAKTLPRALARGRLMLAATITYNTFGALPIALAVAHLAVTALILGAGAHSATAAYRLALLLPHHAASLLLGVLESPIYYMAANYLLVAIEALAAVLILGRLYRDVDDASRAIRRSARYVPLFPLILWLTALASLAGVLLALYRLASRRREGRW